MLDYTEDERRLAERITVAVATSDKTGRVHVTSYQLVFRAALAAIRETTERAAKMINEGGYYDDDVSAFASTEIVEDLRNGEHLKGDHP